MPRHTPNIYDPGISADAQDVLCLHRNENLFVDREWLNELVRDTVDGASIVQYPDPTSLPLRMALAQSYAVEPDHVFVGNGSDEVLASLLGLLRHRFAALGTLDICFKIYDSLATRFEYERTTIPGDTFHTGRIAPSDGLGLCVVDSPNSITGNHLTWETLRPLAEPAGAFLIWDNAYGEFAGDALPRNLPDNVVFVRSFSKFYGLAGLRAGYCIGNANLIRELHLRKDTFNVNSIAQRMAVAALAHQGRFSHAAQRIVACRTDLVTRLGARRFACRESGGNFVLVTHADVTARFVQEELLKRRIAVRRFAGAPTDNYLRITVPPTEGIDQLTHALDEILEQANVARETAT